MSPAEFAQLRAQAEHNGLLLYYAGTFNPHVIQAAADTLKSRLASEDGSSSAKRKLFSTFIEMAQNVLHYAAPLPAADTGPRQALSAPVPQGAIGVGRIDALACAQEAGAEPAPALVETLDLAVREPDGHAVARRVRARRRPGPESRPAVRTRAAGQRRDRVPAEDLAIARPAGVATLARPAVVAAEAAGGARGGGHGPTGRLSSISQVAVGSPVTSSQSTRRTRPDAQSPIPGDSAAWARPRSVTS